VDASTSTSTPTSLDNAKADIVEKFRKGSVKKVMLVLDEVQEQADEEIYRILIRGLLKCGRPDLAVEVYRRRMARSQSMQFELPLAANVLKRCVKDEVHMARQILSEIENQVEQRVQDPELLKTDKVWRLTAHPFLGIIIACLRNGQSDMCRHSCKLLHRGLENKAIVSGETQIYNDAIRELGKLRSIDTIFRVLDCMEIGGIKPDNDTYQFLSQAVVHKVEFVTGAVSMATLPPPLPEVAFVGRSNVGKSSLVNMICGRRQIAKVSKRPGKTRQFNYFLVSSLAHDGQFYLVDLPGVGHAEVAKELRGQWAEFTEQYVTRRETLQVIFHLVDGRYGPLDEDENLMRMISTTGFLNRANYVVVLTKMDKGQRDKPTQSMIDKMRHLLMLNGCPSHIPIIPTSATTKLGRDELWRYLRKVLGA